MAIQLGANPVLQYMIAFKAIVSSIPSGFFQFTCTQLSIRIAVSQIKDRKTYLGHYPGVGLSGVYGQILNSVRPSVLNNRFLYLIYIYIFLFYYKRFDSFSNFELNVTDDTSFLRWNEPCFYTLFH